jgi:hypothetical protein
VPYRVLVTKCDLLSPEALVASIAVIASDMQTVDKLKAFAGGVRAFACTAAEAEADAEAEAEAEEGEEGEEAEEGEEGREIRLGESRDHGYALSALDADESSTRLSISASASASAAAAASASASVAASSSSSCAPPDPSSSAVSVLDLFCKPGGELAAVSAATGAGVQNLWELIRCDARASSRDPPGVAPLPPPAAGEDEDEELLAQRARLVREHIKAPLLRASRQASGSSMKKTKLKRSKIK